MRTSKLINEELHNYYYDGTMLLADVWGDYYIRYVYDIDGSPVGMVYFNGFREYFLRYVKNVQGDIVELRMEDGSLYASYVYGAWGDVIFVWDSSGTLITDEYNIAHLNMLRYRGYCYDTETGLYYLASRYYDPTVGRFINPDIAIGQMGNLASYNMFAYAFNNPIFYVDNDGCWPKLSSVFFAVAAVAVVVAAVAVSVVSYGTMAPAMVAASGGIIGGLSAATMATATSVATYSVAVSAVSVATAVVASAVESSNSQKTNNYSVYKLVDSGGKAQYVGRTKNVEARKKAHEASSNRAGLDLEVIQDNLTYDEARGLEQIEMMVLHTINPDNSMNNQINGIGLRNINLIRYLTAGFDVAGYLENKITNEILCWAGM